MHLHVHVLYYIAQWEKATLYGIIYMYQVTFDKTYTYMYINELAQ